MEERLFWIGIGMGAYVFGTRKLEKKKWLQSRLRHAAWHAFFWAGAAFSAGIVLAFARPALRMTLLEPKRKRASFLRVALAELHCSDVQVVEGRLEAEAESDGPWPADLIVSRATIPPLDLISRSGSRLSSGGRLIVTSGAGVPALTDVREAGRLAGLVHVERCERTRFG